MGDKLSAVRRLRPILNGATPSTILPLPLDNKTPLPFDNKTIQEARQDACIKRKKRCISLYMEGMHISLQQLDGYHRK